MFWQRLRVAVLTGAVLATSAAFTRASDGTNSPSGAPAASADPCNPCPPATRTIYVTEYTSESYEATRTVLKPVQEVEKYTAYRTECVAEQRTRTFTVNTSVPETHEETFTVYVSIPETHEETRTVYTCVPSVEQRTVIKRVVTCVPETVMVRKCVDQGHYECREVPVSSFASLGHGGGHGLFSGLMGKHKHHGGCDECPAEPCECAPATKTVQVWCPNKVWVEEAVTRNVTKVECVPTVENVTVLKSVPTQQTFKVTTCKSVPQQQTRKVTTIKCVPVEKTETYTVQVPKQVAFEATRTVTKCVPTEEKYTATRMVPHQVAKEVPCEEAATVSSSAFGGLGGLGGKLGGLFHGAGRKHGGHHGSSCCD
jgi:hypothetical protein